MDTSDTVVTALRGGGIFLTPGQVFVLNRLFQRPFSRRVVKRTVGPLLSVERCAKTMTDISLAEHWVSQEVLVWDR